MEYTLQEILRFVEENDVKFVKLAFCDIFGVQKNISILSQLFKIFFSDTIISRFCNINIFTY